MTQDAIQVKELNFSYKTRQVLHGVNLNVSRGEIFGLLGPNGSGKTTLFRIISTLLPVAAGFAWMLGADLGTQTDLVRKNLGVVFQAPSLDARLTVEENIRYQGRFYGLRGSALKSKMEEVISKLGLKGREKDIVVKLSGGLKRRVELAKGLMHEPKILILDEPSTGLDPGARKDLWKYLMELRDQEKMTLIVTTHLMDEAERCDRAAILYGGKVVRVGTPEELKSEIGGHVVNVYPKAGADLSGEIEARFNVKAVPLDGFLQIDHPQGPELVAKIVEAFPGRVDSVTYRRPTLEDVFMHHTGHRFWADLPQEAGVV